MISARFAAVSAGITLLVVLGPLPAAGYDPGGIISTSAMSGIGARGEPLSNHEIAQQILSAPPMRYPKISRRLRSRGSGLYEMRIDTGSGKVNQVAILKGAGARLLDIEAMRALGTWRFKPGAVRSVRVPVTFRLSWRADVPDN